MVLHRLLAIGLEKIAREHPATVLQYLLEDPRRFAIRNINNEHCDSQGLISAIVPSSAKDEAFRLETAIREWTWVSRGFRTPGCWIASSTSQVHS